MGPALSRELAVGMLKEQRSVGRAAEKIAESAGISGTGISGQLNPGSPASGARTIFTSQRCVEICSKSLRKLAAFINGTAEAAATGTGAGGGLIHSPVTGSPPPRLAKELRTREGGATAGETIAITINNPIGEPAETSLLRTMKNLSAVGVLSPTGV